MEEWFAFENFSVLDSDEESMNVSLSEEGEIWKRVSDENYYSNLKYSSKKLKQQSETFFYLDDFINANHNYESLNSWLSCKPKSNPNMNKNYLNSNFSIQKDLVCITIREFIPKVKRSANNQIKNIALHPMTSLQNLYINHINKILGMN